MCHPSAPPETVALLIVPWIGRVSRNFTQPIFGRRTALHFAVQAAGLDFATGEAERVADAFFARGWVAGASGEEVPEGAGPGREGPAAGRKRRRP